MKHHFAGDRVKTLTRVRIPATLVVVRGLSLILRVKTERSTPSSSTEVNDLTTVHSVINIGRASMNNLHFDSCVFPPQLISWLPRLSEGELHEIWQPVHFKADVTTWA